MTSVSIEVGGLRSPADVLTVERLESGRSIVRVRSGSAFERGRSCVVHDETGRSLECVVAKCTKLGEAYVVEFRCVEDGDFFTVPAQQA